MKVLLVHVGNEVRNPDLSKEFYLERKSLLDGKLKYYLKHDIINADIQMQSLIDAGIEVEYGHFSSRKSIIGLLKAGKKIRLICKREGIDLVHVLWGSTTALLTVIVSTTPVIISFCGSDLLGNKSISGRLTVGGRINRIFSKIAARFSDHIITKSEKMASILSQKIRAKTSIIPNGIVLDEFYPLPTLDCKIKLGWDTSKKHVLFFYTEGQVVKNSSMAKEVMEIVKQKIPVAELVIATKIPHENLVYYYNASDIMILTSFHEGSNNSLKEARACNLPIVSVDVGDAKERLKYVNACHVIDSYDPDEFAEKVVEVLKSGKKSDGTRYSDEVSIGNVASQIIEVYKKVLAV
jgi:teichuronic acid biosynthesis glycosyltransferase TuaC